MTDSDIKDEDPIKKSPDTIRAEYAEASGAGYVMFQPDELDLYVNKVTLESFVFHGKELNYDELERAEYDPKNFTVNIFKTDGSEIDLGIKIQWLIRAYWSKSPNLYFVQTKDGKSIRGKSIPMTHKGK